LLFVPERAGLFDRIQLKYNLHSIVVDRFWASPEGEIVEDGIVSFCCHLTLVREVVCAALPLRLVAAAFAAWGGSEGLRICRDIKVQTTAGGLIMSHEMDEVGRLTDAELVCSLEHLVKADRALSAKLLVHLGEVYERKLHLGMGYRSLHEYCIAALGMSDAEAYLRIQAAKLGRRFPLVLERFGAGDVHLSAIKLLDPVLSEENHVQLLDRARGKTKRQVEVLVAELAPKPDVPARLRKLPDARGKVAAAAPDSLSAPQACSTALTSSAAQSIAVFQSASHSSSLGVASVASPVAPSVPVAPVAPSHAFVLQPLASRAAPVAAVSQASSLQTFALQSPRARASLKPLSPGRFKLELTLGQDSHDKLEQLRELLRHQNPSGDLTSIVERALSELLGRTLKQRFAQTNALERPVARANARPRPDVAVKAKVQSNTSASKSRYIPRKVVREVHARDAGQCTFVSPEGRRCTARGFLEVHHHATTFARGGEATADNLRLTCRAHNLLLADRDYGRLFM
jgi:hypothetical protein